MSDTLGIVRAAHGKANETGVAQCIVSTKSGGLILVPDDQCRVKYLERVESVTKRYSKSD